jgi:hypothetical protein
MFLLSKFDEELVFKEDESLSQLLLLQSCVQPQALSCSATDSAILP